jgi:hypothetical protein
LSLNPSLWASNHSKQLCSELQCLLKLFATPQRFHLQIHIQSKIDFMDSVT